MSDLIIRKSSSSSAAGLDTQIQFNSAGAFGADAGLTWDNTNKQFIFTKNSLGSTQSSTSNILLTNTTAAANSAQQISPAINMRGNVWSTSGSSQTVDIRQYNIPIQNATTPIARYAMESSINNAAYRQFLSISSNPTSAVMSLGVLNSSTGQYTMQSAGGGSVGITVPNSGLSSYNLIFPSNSGSSGNFLYQPSLGNLGWASGALSQWAGAVDTSITYGTGGTYKSAYFDSSATAIIGDVDQLANGANLQIGGVNGAAIFNLNAQGLYTVNGPDGASFSLTGPVSLNGGDTETVTIFTGQAGTLTIYSGDGDPDTDGGICIVQGGADGGTGVSGYLSLNPNGVPLKIGGIISATNKITVYNNVSTNGMGVPAIYKTGRLTGQTAAAASVASYTIGASDGTFIVSANVNVTTATINNFNVQCTYTDETNTSRTLTFSFSNLTGTILNAITNTLGTGPFEGIPLHIRVKASTAITIKTTGTFTTVTYNVEGCITQFA